LIDAVTGVTAIDFSGFVTVSVTDGETTVPRVAVIPLMPTLTPVAKPLALIVATEVVADVHVTLAVMFAVEPSL